ncbi:MAG TPA: hypothetical protein VKJ65_03555, partial [Phycisphaerae bacterium]|nr:hypothetical protein [Phycisphaerae bacterium]
MPTGADTLDVTSTSGWQVGDQILIQVTETAAWIQYMGMDTLWRNGAQQTWINAGSIITTERTITAIDGNQITLDAPISDSINSNLQPGAYVEEYTSSVISQVGVQNMQILAEGPAQSVAGGGDEVVAFQGITNSWIQNLNTKDTFNTIEINDNTSKITVQNVNITHSAIVSGDDAPADFAVNGASEQILFTNLTITGNQDWYFTEGGGVTGPIVLMDSTFTGNGAVEPHQRWNTGLLIDNVQVIGGTIQLIDRGTAGSGQGQSAGASVIWNSSATAGITVQNPPGTETWSIGDTGSINTYGEPGGDGTAEPMGILYSPGVAISGIPSLYEAQLAQRLANNTLPTGWTNQDIGGPEAIGTSGYNHTTEVWTINGSGADIYGTSDQFQFDSESVSGNAVISAEVDSQI